MNDIGKATPRGTKGEISSTRSLAQSESWSHDGTGSHPGCGTGHDVRAIAVPSQRPFH